MIFVGLEKGHKQSRHMFQYHQKQNLQRRTIKSLKSNPMHSTNPIPQHPHKKKLYPKNFIHLSPQNKANCKHLKFPRILPSKQTNYLAKLMDFVLY
jgi:hypothetical protein